MADLPAGSDAWLLHAERVRLGLAQRSLTRDEIKKLSKEAKRKRDAERRELSAELTAKMNTNPSDFTASMAEAEALRRGFSDLDAKNPQAPLQRAPGQGSEPPRRALHLWACAGEENHGLGQAHARVPNSDLQRERHGTRCSRHQGHAS